MIERVAMALAALTALAPAAGAAGSGPRMTAAPPHTEDLAAMPGGRWVIASGMAHGTEKGALFAVDARTGAFHALDFSVPAAHTDCPPPDLTRFAPHGIDLEAHGHGPATLYVVNHGGRESVEMFAVATGPTGPSLRWTGCALVPRGKPNAVAALGDGFAVSLMHDPPDASGFKRMQAGEPIGSVLAWTKRSGWRTLVAHVAGPNGIAVSRDRRHLYVSEWPLGKIARYAIAGGAPDREIMVDFLPDNLRWGADGRLLATGQHGTAFGAIDCATGKGPCIAGTHILRLDPATLATVRSCRLGTDAAFFPTAAIDVGTEIWTASVIGVRFARAARSDCDPAGG